MPNSNGSLLIAMQLQAREIFLHNHHTVNFIFHKDIKRYR